MKISSSDWYKEHTDKDCECPDLCERNYCGGKTHRLLYRTCEGTRDHDESGELFTNECPRCHQEWKAQEYRRWAESRTA